MFGVGALPALLIFFIRRNVEEPKVSAETRTIEELRDDKPAIWESSSLESRELLSCRSIMHRCARWILRYHNLASEVSYDRTEASIVGSTGYLAALIIGSFAGYLAGAWLAIELDEGTFFLIFSVGAIALVITYTQVPLTNEMLWFIGFPLGFFASGYFSGIGPFLTELYPTRLRGSGQGFCYNFGRGLGASFPTLVGFIFRKDDACQCHRHLRNRCLLSLICLRFRFA